MTVEDGQLRLGQAAEQVARARCRFEQVGAQDHVVHGRHWQYHRARRVFRWEVSTWPIAPLTLWDSTRLRLLVEIGRQRSVSAAARAIGIGQPTASEHLRTLESAAGRPRRTRRTRRPSHRSGHRPRTPRGTGAPDPPRWRGGAARLAGLELGTIHRRLDDSVSTCCPTRSAASRDHPNVTVEVEIASTGDILERLLAGQVQLALVGDAGLQTNASIPSPSSATRSSASPGPASSPLTAAKRPRKDIALQTLLVREPRSSTRQISDHSTSRNPAGTHLGLDSTEAIRPPPVKDSASPSSRCNAVAEEIGRRAGGSASPSDAARGGTSTSPVAQRA